MNRAPPRKAKFVEEMLRYADDDSHGYSQKPPSGRWGPDFDCSSLIYQAASNAGYDVGTGRDKVRFTGTMLKDFEKAGFQILPFANVGISDLEIGDILLNLALHAEVYVGEGQSVGATASETGAFVGEEGDQTGHEIERHPVVTFDKDWDYILRAPDEESDETTEEGGDEVPMYNQPGQGMNGMYSPTTYNPNPMMGGYPQGNMPMQGMNGMRQGYPQGNLGQMNGYSQANAGGYPQSGGYQQGMMPMGPQGMDTDLCFVMGIEGAKNLKGMPNTRKAVFDEDQPLMFIVSFDQQGNVNNINVYQFEECSEEMPQHLSPLMQQTPMGNTQMQQPMGQLNREDIMQMIREVMQNESSTSAEKPSQATNPQRNANSNNSRNNRSN